MLSIGLKPDSKNSILGKKGSLKKKKHLCWASIDGEKRFAELVTTESGTVAQLWCTVEGHLHWCHCISLSQRVEKSHDRETLLQVVCFCLMSVIWEPGMERKAVGRRRRHKRRNLVNLLVNSN